MQEKDAVPTMTPSNWTPSGESCETVACEGQACARGSRLGQVCFCLRGDLRSLLITIALELCCLEALRGFSGLEEARRWLCRSSSPPAFSYWSLMAQFVPQASSPELHYCKILGPIWVIAKTFSQHRIRYAIEGVWVVASGGLLN